MHNLMVNFVSNVLIGWCFVCEVRVFGLGTGPQSLLILLLLLGATLFEKSLRLLHFESHRHEIWHDDFKRYFSSIDGVNE